MQEELTVREATIDEAAALAGSVPEGWTVYADSPVPEGPIVLSPEAWKKFCELAGLDETGQPKVD